MVNGVLALDNTPISVKWKDVDAATATTYAAGSFARIVIDLDDSGALEYAANSPVKITFRNTTTGAETSLVVYGDSAPTDTEIAAAFVQQVGLFANVSDYVLDAPNSHPAVAEVLDIDFNNADYNNVFVETNNDNLAVGTGITITDAVVPVGAGDAAHLAGYNPATTYNKFDLLVRSTLTTNGKDSAVLHQHTVYVDDSIALFATEFAGVVGQVTATTVAHHKEYTAVI